MSNSSEGNGIAGYVNLPATEKGNKITFSDTTTSDAIFYQPKPFVGYPHVQGLYAKQEGVWNEKSLLYFLSLFKAAAFGRFDYAAKFTRVIALAMEVVLPIRSDGKIDFAYMEAYIRELEAARLRELEKYLAAAGFDNCKLTKPEQRAIEDWKIGKPLIKMFVISDLYYKVKLRKAKVNKRSSTSQRQDSVYSIPLVNAKYGNNGIMFYGKEECFESAETTIDVIQNGEIATGKVYPQPQRTGVLWDAYLIKALNHNDTENSLVFISCAIEKAIKERYDRDNKATWGRVSKETIALPVKESGEIDYAFIETFIRGTMKRAISGVIAWKDKEIAATKSVIGK